MLHSYLSLGASNERMEISRFQRNQRTSCVRVIAAECTYLISCQSSLSFRISIKNHFHSCTLQTRGMSRYFPSGIFASICSNFIFKNFWSLHHISYALLTTSAVCSGQRITNCDTIEPSGMLWSAKAASYEVEYLFPRSVGSI